MLAAWLKLRDYLSNDLFGGPRMLKAAWVINLQKGGTLLFVLGLMWRYDVWTPTAWGAWTTSRRSGGRCSSAATIEVNTVSPPAAGTSIACSSV